MLFPNENLEIDRYISLRDIHTFGKTLLLNADLDKSIYPCYCLIQYYVVLTGVSIKDTEKKNRKPQNGASNNKASFIVNPHNQLPCIQNLMPINLWRKRLHNVYSLKSTTKSSA